MVPVGVNGAESECGETLIAAAWLVLVDASPGILFLFNRLHIHSLQTELPDHTSS